MDIVAVIRNGREDDIGTRLLGSGKHVFQCIGGKPLKISHQHDVRSARTIKCSGSTFSKISARIGHKVDMDISIGDQL